MSYAIFRTQKLKSRVSICRAIQHDSRDRPPLNADPMKSDLNEMSGNTSEAMRKYTNMLPEKVRKNAVHGIEVVCTASPEFSGDWDAYLKKAKEWADTLFGGSDNCLHWSIHRDETTPHLHAVYMPLVSGKLNAKSIIGGSRDRMRQLQSDYHKQVGEQFGLLRGVEKSTATHSSLREFSKIMSEQKKQIELREKSISTREKFADFVARKFKPGNSKRNQSSLEAEINQLRLAYYRQEKKLNEVNAVAEDWRNKTPVQLREIATLLENTNCKNANDYLKNQSQKRTGRGR